MQTALAQHSVSKSRTSVIVAWVLAVIVVAFMLFDIFGKLTRPQPVVDAFARQGMPLAMAPAIGAILLALVILYAIPRTRVFATVLLTGYFGGAAATSWRAGDPTFEAIFPILFCVLVWGPVYLTDERVRALIPISRARS